MSIAHICPVCGTQLARTRAAVDAVYRLPVVVCSCGFATVRRRHPLVARWRASIAAARTFAALALQVFLLLALSLATAGFVTSIVRELRDLGLHPGSLITSLVGGGGHRFSAWLYDDGGVILLGAWVLVSTASGVWLRATLGHWRWPRPIAAWSLVVAAWMWMETLLWPLSWLDGLAITGEHPTYGGPGLRESGHLAILLAVSLAMSAAAAPAGRGVAHLMRGSRSHRFIRKLRKRRSARRGE